MGGFGSVADEQVLKQQKKPKQHNSPITGVDSQGNKY
jgi:hypothetical protein